MSCYSRLCDRRNKIASLHFFLNNTPDFIMNIFWCSFSIDGMNSFVFLCNVFIPFEYFSMELRYLGFYPVIGRIFPPQHGKLERNLKKKRDIRIDACCCKSIDILNEFEIDLSSEPLIRNSRIDETIENDNCMILERRYDHFMHKLCAACGEKKELCLFCKWI